MQIQSVKLIPYQLSLKQAWQTNRGDISIRNGWLVELTTNTGLTGYGDCAPLPSAGTETPSDAHHRLKAQCIQLQHQTLQHALEQLPATREMPAARCAIETALIDVISQSEQQTLRNWLNPDAKDSIDVNCMIGQLDSNSLQQATHAIGQGFQVLKLKVGINKLKDDIQRLEDLCAHLPAAVRLRLDANGAWNDQEAGLFIKSIKGLPIESIEEPLQQPEAGKLRRLQDATTTALALDESIDLLGQEELLKNQIVKRLVIKPMARGGLLPALSLARQAASRDIETVITSTLESAIGLQAAAQLSAAMPVTENMLAHGLAVSEWLVNNTAPPPVITRARLQLPDNNGLGLLPYKG